MARLRLTSPLYLALGLTVLAAPPAQAQSAAPASSTGRAPAQSSPVLAPKSSAEKSESSESGSTARRSRPISSGVAAALAAAAPKYTPPPTPREPTPEAERPDLREIDKPKNTIVRLPTYIVQEPKPAVFSERTISTEKGLTDIAVRRYISDLDLALNRFTIPLFGASYQQRAMAMYEEEERLRNMSDLGDNARAAGLSDPAAGDYIRRETRETYMRTSDFGWKSGDPR